MKTDNKSTLLYDMAELLIDLKNCGSFYHSAIEIDNYLDGGTDGEEFEKRIDALLKRVAKLTEELNSNPDEKLKKFYAWMNKEHPDVFLLPHQHIMARNHFGIYKDKILVQMARRGGITFMRNLLNGYDKYCIKEAAQC